MSQPDKFIQDIGSKCKIEWKINYGQCNKPIKFEIENHQVTIKDGLPVIELTEEQSKKFSDWDN